MDGREYSRRLWTYSVLVVLAGFFSAGTPILMFLKLPGAVSLTFSIIAVVLFVYATVWFGSYLKLEPEQWVVVVLLAILAWVGTVVYLLTRRPAARAAVRTDTAVERPTEAGD